MYRLKIFENNDRANRTDCKWEGENDDDDDVDDNDC